MMFGVFQFYVGGYLASTNIIPRSIICTSTEYTVPLGYNDITFPRGQIVTSKLSLYQENTMAAYFQEKMAQISR